MDKELKELEHLGVISSNQSLPSMSIGGCMYIYIHVNWFIYTFMYVCLHVSVYDSQFIICF